MNLEKLQQLAVALYENHQKIEYFNFLESIRKSSNNEDTKAILEAVTQGFGIMYEADVEGEEESEVDASEAPQEPQAAPEAKSVPPGFRDYVNLTNKLKAGTIAKFQKDPSGETAKMMGILKNGVGQLKVKTLNKFRDFNVVTDYEYIPDAPSTEADKENAKSVLISSALPHYVYQGVQIGRTHNYEEAGHDFIVDALNGGYGTPPVTERLNNFIAAYDPAKKGTFMAWEKRGLSNLKKHAIATSEGTTVTSKVWNAERPYKKGDVVNHGRKNWKAVQEEVPPGMEPGKDNNYWEPLEKKLDEISLDAPVGASGQDDDDTTTVGDSVKSSHDTAEDTETKVTVNELLNKLPKNEKFDKIRKMLNMRFNEDKDLEEIGNAFGISKARVGQLFDEVFKILKPLAQKGA